MPEEKQKLESYTNLGGENRKVSPYITPENEFLTIQNLDFRTLGSLSSTPGTSMYGTVSASTSITGLADFYATGTTFYSYGSITYTLVATDRYNAYNITGGTFASIFSFLYPNNPTPFSFLKASSLYGSNQWDFFNYSGSTTAIQYGLPKPFLPITFTSNYGTGGLSGFLTLSFAFVRNDGLYGPAIFQTYPVSGWSGFIFNMPGLNTFSGFIAATFPVRGLTMGDYGVSGTQVWYSLNGSAPRGTANLIPTTATSFAISDNFATYTLTDPQPEDYFGTFGWGFDLDNGAGLTGSITFPTNPACNELYSNQLFSGGFLNSPDTVWYSQVGQLEKHDNEAFFDVRASDGDIVSCLISYFTQLVIFKVNSTHSLSGTDPDTFTLTEVTTQYGCLSSRAACVWRQNLWFLDKAGIVAFNGADTKVISSPMEEYFRRMNISAARTEAIMLHVKERNEVWCVIPIDGSSYNNLVVIYDYEANAWRTRTVEKATAVSTLTRGIDRQIVYQGSFSGSISTYGASLFTDQGTAFTSVIKSRFHAPMGHTVEKQFRRLYFDCKVPQGSTQVFALNLYTNQGVSPALQTTMVLSAFQNRIDFGLPGADFAFEAFYSGGEFLQFNGYTIEYRFQRAVSTSAN